MLDIVELSRLQCALTAMYHCLFVPLTPGLALLPAFMQTAYVLSANQFCKDMTQFWRKSFGTTCAMVVATGLPLV
ncbi:cytochrome bd-I ubiquinol oxidase subunit CydA, partial [Escherichia coli]|uniref:cytochrome ubiquinol oxidase subunit I n=1 Tax=Escherichia coli TaxID=562 RepID=UPI0010273FE8